MVSLKDVAQACGVSVATVSKALNDQTDIGEKTRRMIKEKARQMGYLPNSVARALKTNRSLNLGVLFADEANSGLTHDYFAAVLEGLRREAEEKGYDITFVSSNRKRDGRMSCLEHVRYRGFDGVVIACADFEDPEVKELVDSDVPVVTIDHIFNSRTSILSDNVKGMRDLLHFIHEKGHRRIAYIHGADSSVTRNRLASFHKTAEELGLSIPDEYVLEAAYRDIHAASAATERLLDLPVPPTCILYPDDYACFGAINTIYSRGLSIPDDISVAGYDGIRIGRQMKPRLTTLVQDTDRIGRLAASELIGLIEHPKTSIPGIILVEGSVYPGGTVADLL